MKKFNLKLITPLILTLILQGCMPDSLTKFKKEPPIKKAATAAATTTSPVVDDSGNLISFDPPTKFYFISQANPTSHLTINTAVNIDDVVDGSLADSTVSSKFFVNCELVTTGRDAQTVALPSGISLSATTCGFSGKPVSIKTVMTAFCSDSGQLTELGCEAAPLVWNSTTSTCSNLDYQYATQAACESGYNKWYKVGEAIPYQIKMNYKDSDNVAHAIYTTVNLSSLATLTSLSYSQSDKLLLSATATSSGNFSDITSLFSSTATPYLVNTAYGKANTIVDTNGVVGVAKIIDSTGGKIGANKLVVIKVASTTPFTQYGFISKSGDTTIVGKIFSIDSSTKTLYVENISADNKYFAKNDSIKPNKTGAGVDTYTITDIDDSYIFKATSLDSDSQYYSSEYTLSKTTNVYEVSFAIKPLKPISSEVIDSANAITYTISPALPGGLTLSSTTGEISGTFADTLDTTLFTITATNPISSTTKGIYLSAIMAPKDFSLSNKQIITVSTTAFFKEGETLFQAITPPLTTSVEGKIVKILNGYQMAVETTNGVFIEDRSLDSGSAYFAEKAFIIPKDSCVNTDITTPALCVAPLAWSTGEVYYNIAITIDTTGGYVAGDYINSLSGSGLGAKGVVAGVYTAANDVLFVKFITQSATGTSSVKSFYEGDGLDFGATVVYIENESLKLGGANFADFKVGSDITSNGNSSAYIHKLTDSITDTIYVSDISKSTGATPLSAGDSLNHRESSNDPADGDEVVTSATHDNLFIMERGRTSEITANLTEGNGVIYSITPTLPTGISLDSKTGKISGSASVAMARKDFILTAKNFIGSETFVFSLEVRDYFQLSDATGVSSFLLHKVGDNQINRKCRINSNDILSSGPNLKAIDVRCFLEAEEEDLYFNKLKLSASTGPGICEYIQYAPYYFKQYSPAQSAGLSSKYKTKNIVSLGCLENGEVPTNDLCEGYYSDTISCDEGYLEYTENNYALTDPADPATCALDTTVTKTVACGGKKVNCITGPVTEILTSSQLEKGHRSLIYASPSGLTKTWTHASPFDKDDLTNLRVANHSIKNKCYNTAANITAWTTASRAQNAVSEPFAGAVPNEAGPYYTINCLDAAKEIKARIRLVIRDWDKAFRIDNGIDNQDYVAPPANMNNAGSDIFSNPYNNYHDWDDAYSGLAANYLGGSCGALTPAPAGTCTGAWPANAAECTAVKGTWGAACDFDNQYQCLLHEGVWTGDEDYKFPGDSI